MTTFNIIDITPAGALCNALDAANRSGRNSRPLNDTEREVTDSEATGGTEPLLTVIGKRVWTLFRSCRVFSGKTA